MKIFIKASLLFAVCCAFSSCAKESARPIEAGNGNPPVNDQGDAAKLSKNLEVKCTLTKTGTVKKGDVTEKRELIQSEEWQSKGSSADDKNVLIESSGRVSQSVKKVNEDGSKTEVDAFVYSYEKTNNMSFKETATNTFLRTEAIKELNTAGEGYFFKVDGKEVKTEKIEMKRETEFFDDGKTQKILSVKEDGETLPPGEGKYKSEEKTEGDVRVETTTLQESYTPSAKPDEKIETSVEVCRFKEIK